MSFRVRLMNYLFSSLTNAWGQGAEIASKFVSLPPLVLRIRITNKCNLSCNYCYVKDSLNQTTANQLTMEEWSKIIANLPPYTIVDITGGEPFMAPDIDRILDALLCRKLKVSLITNGTVRKEALFKKIVNGNLSHLMISLDGSELIHDSIRGVGTFKRAMGTVTDIMALRGESKKKSPVMIAKITVTERNASEIKEFTSYLLNEIGIDGVTLNLMFQNKARDGIPDANDIEDEKFSEGNMASFNPERIDELTRAVSETRAAFPDSVQVRPEIKQEELRGYFENPSRFLPVNCYKYRSVITLYSDGTLSPCDLGLNVGNIRQLDYDLSSSIKQKKMQNFFNYIRRKGSQNFLACGGCCLKEHRLIV